MHLIMINPRLDRSRKYDYKARVNQGVVSTMPWDKSLPLATPSVLVPEQAGGSQCVLLLLLLDPFCLR